MAVQFVLFSGDPLRRRFYRRTAPRLGEPIFESERDRASNHPSMHCGRDTGHLGSGLYFFGTLRAAIGPQAWNAGIRLSPEVFRVEGGPQAPYIAQTFEDTLNLHRFGKALICYPEALHDVVTARADLATSRTLSRDDTVEARRYLSEVEARLHRYADTLTFHGPRLEKIQRTYDASDWKFQIPERCRRAIEQYLRRQDYHPMTYYMRSLGYDGVLHKTMQQMESGDIGCIWYPETEVLPNPTPCLRSSRRAASAMRRSRRTSRRP